MTEKKLFNKHLLGHIFSLFEGKGENEKFYTKKIFKNLHRIFVLQKICDNKEFFNNVISNFKSFEEVYKDLDDWRVQQDALKAFNYTLEYFFTEEFTPCFISFLIQHLSKENYQLQNEITKIFAKLMKYFKVREEILKLINTELYNNKSFYKRRLYLTFFEACLEIFSIKFVTEMGILENFLKIFDESGNKNCIVLAKAISILKDFYPLIDQDYRLKFILMNKLEVVRKNISNKCITDTEVILAMERFDLWYESFLKEWNEFNMNGSAGVYKEIIQNDAFKMEEELRSKEKENYLSNIVNTENRRSSKNCISYKLGVNLIENIKN